MENDDIMKDIDSGTATEVVAFRLTYASGRGEDYTLNSSGR